jgi:hypothetical protein
VQGAGEEKEARAKCNSMPTLPRLPGRRSGAMGPWGFVHTSLPQVPPPWRFAGKAFFTGGSLRGALRLAAANANP